MTRMVDEKFEKEENKEFALKIENICDIEEEFENLVIDDEFRTNLISLFEDSAVKNMIKMSNKLSLPEKKIFDGFHYFFTDGKLVVWVFLFNIFRVVLFQEVFQDDYDPSFDDKIHSRKPTTNMEPYRFMLNKTKIELTDVGGQKSELVRIYCYNSWFGIIFNY